MSDDTRLERLFDYTKFHIGIYLSAGGALLAIVGGVSDGNAGYLSGLVGCRFTLLSALFFMALAGFCGGVVASAATQVTSFDDVWSKKQGPARLLKGKSWAFIEHGAFWLSVLLFCISVLTGASFRAWWETGGVGTPAGASKQMPCSR